MAAARARTLADVLAQRAHSVRDAGHSSLASLNASVQPLLEQGKAQWEVYQPRDALQWLAFLGAGLLALSVLGTVLIIVSGLLLAAAWVGLLVFSITVFTASFAAVFCGTAMLFFSGTCAVIGTSVLSTAAGLFVVVRLASRAKQVGVHYLDTMQVSTGKLQHRPQLTVQHHHQQHSVHAAGESSEPLLSSNPLFAVAAAGSDGGAAARGGSSEGVTLSAPHVSSSVVADVPRPADQDGGRGAAPSMCAVPPASGDKQATKGNTGSSNSSSNSSTANASTTPKAVARAAAAQRQAAVSSA